MNNSNYNDCCDNNINLTILNEIAKAGKMGMDSISYLTQKISDETMKENLSTQYSEYSKVVCKINDLFKSYGEIPDKTPTSLKMMSWTGIKLNTMTNTSNSKIAEMMIQGNNMGIIECQKLLNHNSNANDEIKSILNDFITLQKNQIEKMKEFL